MTARCRKCGGRAVEGVALMNTVYVAEDFPGVRDHVGATCSYTGPPEMVDVLKCEDCGHSFRPRVTTDREE